MPTLNLPAYKRYDYVPAPDLVQRVKAATTKFEPGQNVNPNTGTIGTMDYSSQGQIQSDIPKPPELQPITRYTSSLQAIKDQPLANESIGQSYQNRMETTLQGGRNATQTVIDIMEAKRQEAERLRQQKMLKALWSSRNAVGSVNAASLGSTGGMIFGGKAGAELDTIGKKAVALASKSIGVWYKYGGTNLKTGVDCSGLIWSVYKALGINLPRVSRDQARSGRIIGQLRDARPGDIVVMDSPALGHNRHVALYAGNGWMIEAPHTGARVQRTRLRNYNIIVRPY